MRKFSVFLVCVFFVLITIGIAQLEESMDLLMKISNPKGLVEEVVIQAISEKDPETARIISFCLNPKQELKGLIEESVKESYPNEYNNYQQLMGIYSTVSDPLGTLKNKILEEVMKSLSEENKKIVESAMQFRTMMQQFKAYGEIFFGKDGVGENTDVTFNEENAKIGKFFEKEDEFANFYGENCNVKKEEGLLVLKMNSGCSGLKVGNVEFKNLDEGSNLKYNGTVLVNAELIVGKGGGEYVLGKKKISAPEGARIIYDHGPPEKIDLDLREVTEKSFTMYFKDEEGNFVNPTKINLLPNGTLGKILGNRVYGSNIMINDIKLVRGSALVVGKNALELDKGSVASGFGLLVNARDEGVLFGYCIEKAKGNYVNVCFDKEKLAKGVFPLEAEGKGFSFELKKEIGEKIGIKIEDGDTFKLEMKDGYVAYDWNRKMLLKTGNLREINGEQIIEWKTSDASNADLVVDAKKEEISISVCGEKKCKPKPMRIPVKNIRKLGKIDIEISNYANAESSPKIQGKFLITGRAGKEICNKKVSINSRMEEKVEEKRGQLKNGVSYIERGNYFKTEDGRGFFKLYNQYVPEELLVPGTVVVVDGHVLLVHHTDKEEGKVYIVENLFTETARTVIPYNSKKRGVSHQDGQPWNEATIYGLIPPLKPLKPEDIDKGMKETHVISYFPVNLPFFRDCRGYVNEVLEKAGGIPPIKPKFGEDVMEWWNRVVKEDKNVIPWSVPGLYHAYKIISDLEHCKKVFKGEERVCEKLFAKANETKNII